MRSYADFYGKQNVFLELKDSNKLLFANVPSTALSNIADAEVTKDSYKLKVLSSNMIHYLYIAGKLSGPYGDYTLIYVRDLSDLYNNHSQLTRYLISVSSLVETVLDLKIKENFIKLDIDSLLNEITGDFILLQSLLVNLVDNAVKASPNGSSIQLSAYFNAVPILEVKDSGCGMDDEQTALVCEPFYRVDKARSRGSVGIGLGLSLCREIAHLHEAELRINSCPGNGTTVQLIFTTPLQSSENSLMPEDA